MGKTGNVLKHYFRDKQRFADLFNGVCFQGNSIIQAENLTDASEIYVEPEAEKTDTQEKASYLERIRDIKMKLHTGEMLQILAVENQNQVDYTMPFRCMQYDTMEYSSQLEELRKKNEAADDYESWAERACKIKKTDRIMPVYTLCFYHGEEVWDGPKSLRDMMNFGEDADSINKLFVDYPMHLYCLNEEDKFDVFHTEIKQLFKAARYRKDKRKLRQLLEEDSEYRHMDEDTLEVLSIMLNAPQLWENKEKYMNRQEEKEGYDMCQALREWAEDERREGESLLATLMSRLFSDNRTEDAMRAANDEEARRQLYREYGIID